MIAKRSNEKFLHINPGADGVAHPLQFDLDLLRLNGLLRIKGLRPFFTSRRIIPFSRHLVSHGNKFRSIEKRALSRFVPSSLLAQ